MTKTRILRPITGLIAAMLVGYFLYVAYSSEQPSGSVQLTDLRDDYRFAFARSSGQQKVVAVDITNQTKVAEIEFPHRVGEILVSKLLSMLFINDPDHNSITPVFLKDLSKAPSLEIGFSPVESILGPDDQFAAFVGSKGELQVLDLKNIRSVYQNAGIQPGAKISFSIFGQELLIVEGERNQILMVNLEKQRIIGVADLTLKSPSKQVSAVSRSPDGRTGFIAVENENRVLVLDLVNLKVTRSVSVGESPVRPYVTNDGSYLLIANAGSKDFNVIDMMSYEVIATIHTGVVAHAINAGFLDTRAFVMPEEGGTIAVIDLVKLKAIEPIELPGPTDKGLVTVDSKTLLTTIPSTGQIANINILNNHVHKLIDTGLEDVRGIKMGVVNAICH